MDLLRLGLETGDRGVSNQRNTTAKLSGTTAKQTPRPSLLLLFLLSFTVYAARKEAVEQCSGRACPGDRVGHCWRVASGGDKRDRVQEHVEKFVLERDTSSFDP